MIKDKNEKFLNKTINLGIFNSNIIKLTQKIVGLIKRDNVLISHEKHNIDKIYPIGYHSFCWLSKSRDSKLNLAINNAGTQKTIT